MIRSILSGNALDLSGSVSGLKGTVKAETKEFNLLNIGYVNQTNGGCFYPLSFTPSFVSRTLVMS